MFASFLLWVLFSIYWEIAATNSAPAVASESNFSRGIHVVLANAALLVMSVPILGLNQRLLPDATTVKLVGLETECAGLA